MVLRLKIFTSEGDHVASVNDYRAAALLASHYGTLTTVRLSHGKKQTIWIEGVEKLSATERRLRPLDSAVLMMLRTDAIIGADMEARARATTSLMGATR